MPENIVLRLTPEELYLLQTALALDTLPGFASDLLAGLDDSQREQALNTADHDTKKYPVPFAQFTTSHYSPL